MMMREMKTPVNWNLKIFEILDERCITSVVGVPWDEMMYTLTAKIIFKRQYNSDATPYAKR